jgi:hypothetical protein
MRGTIPPLPQYFMERCLVKHREDFIFYCLEHAVKCNYQADRDVGKRTLLHRILGNQAETMNLITVQSLAFMMTVKKLYFTIGNLLNTYIYKCP